jgi:hypothetical protein
MFQGRPFKHIDPIGKHLSEESERLRKEARGTPAGVERDKLIRRAQIAETASHMREWLSSPGLKVPDLR